MIFLDGNKLRVPKRMRRQVLWAVSRSSCLAELATRKHTLYSEFYVLQMYAHSVWK